MGRLTMGVLEDYESKFGLKPLTAEQISDRIFSSEEHMEGCTNHGIRTTLADEDRVLLWLNERVLELYARLGDLRGTMVCGWCWKAAGLTQEIWRDLPKYTLPDAQEHALTCEHNPLVVRNRELQAQLDHARGLLGAHEKHLDSWCRKPTR
jgi:hypothetical protein